MSIRDLADAGVVVAAAHAADRGTTKTAAAVELWLPRLAGAVVAIGNAPTALFHLLEVVEESGVKPAAVVGIPVGFVGAAESKEALIANGLQLGDYLWLGEGELKSGGHKRPSILADALEPVLGAIWLDGGFAAVEAVVERLFGQRLSGIDPKAGNKDAKTALQEWLQGRKFGLPLYAILRQEGESPDQVFEISCAVLDGELLTRAEGPSRRAAEQLAAAEALRLLIERHPGKGKKRK